MPSCAEGLASGRNLHSLPCSPRTAGGGCVMFVWSATSAWETGLSRVLAPHTGAERQREREGKTGCGPHRAVAGAPWSYTPYLKGGQNLVFLKNPRTVLLARELVSRSRRRAGLPGEEGREGGPRGRDDLQYSTGHHPGRGSRALEISWNFQMPPVTLRFGP